MHGHKLAVCLRDPATRARIRKDLTTPSDTWDIEWQEMPGPDAILVSAALNPELRQFQGKRISEIAKERHKDPIDTICDRLIEVHADTEVSVFVFRRDRGYASGREAHRNILERVV